MGAIRKRGKHYAIQYYDALGKRRWETIGPNLHEARQVLAQRMWERRQGKFRLTRQPITMAEFAAKWDEDYLVVQHQLGRLKESTLVGYRVNLRLHIVPFFRATRLSDIALPHVREFMKALLAKDLVPKTVGNVMVILKEMLKHAVQWGYLDANPAQYAERPRGEDREMQILTPAEIHRLLAHTAEPVRTLLLCAVMTGMRRGELLGLRWEDVDFEGNRIHVRQALWRGKFVTPKSKRSRRAIDMARTVKEALARLPSRFRGELVFCAENGMPIDPENFTKRDWARALRRSACAGSGFTTCGTRTPACSSRRARTRSTSRPSSGTRRSRRRSTATATSCRTSTRRRRASSTAWCSATERAHPEASTDREAARLTRRSGSKTVAETKTGSAP